MNGAAADSPTGLEPDPRRWAILAVIIISHPKERAKAFGAFGAALRLDRNRGGA